MKKSKKLLSLLLAFVMMFGAVSSVMIASAADTKKHLEYNENISKKNVEDLLGILDEMVKELVPTLVSIPDFDLNLDDFANGAYFTNRNAIELTRTLYKLIGDLIVEIDIPGVDASMKPIIAAMFQVPPDTAYQGLPEMAPYLEQAKKDGIDTSTYDSWDQLDFSDVVLGFKDGDKDGFLTALYNGMGYIVATFYSLDRELLPALMGGKNLLIGETGYYNTLFIPVLQTLGISLPDYKAFSNIYAPDDIAGGSQAGIYQYYSRAILAPIVEPVLDLVMDIADAPVSTILEKLPNLLYSFEQGRLDGVLDLLAGIEGAGDIIGLIKNADGTYNHDIVGLLNGTINSVTGALVPGVEFGLPALDVNWNDVMKKLGTKDLTPGYEQTAPQYAINDTDAADMFMYIYNYLADALAMEGNQRLIRAVLVVLGLDESTSKMILEIVTMEREQLLLTVMGLLGVEGLPSGEEDPGKEDPQKPDGGKDDDGNGSGTTEIPQTGDVALSAFAMLAVAGAAGLVIARKKED